MDKELWYGRLIAAIDAHQAEAKRRKPRAPTWSDRGLSKAAGLSVNYVNQMRGGPKNVGASAIYRLCRRIGVSVTYIFTGARMTPEAERFLELFAALPPEDQDELMRLAEWLKRRGAAPPEE